MRTPHAPARSWLGPILRVTIAPVLASVFRTRLVGAERMPAGGVILAGNHVSYADPVLLWCRAPRPTHFMAKAELWENGFIGWVLDNVWAFPVRREAVDRASLAQAATVLAAGEPVGIFPEGRRTLKGAGEGEGHGGAAFLALRSGVPVVPVGIAGTDRIRPAGSRLLHFPQVTIVMGEPISPASFTEGGRKERVDAMTATIMERIREQVSVARRVAER